MKKNKKMKSETVLPYKNQKGEKTEQVETMFDSISSSYDALNMVLSFGINILWRKKAIKILEKEKTTLLLDSACGSGDISLAYAKRNTIPIIGVDISEKMLAVAQKKALKNKYEHLTFQKMNGERLSFEDNSFDAVTIGYGIRNYADPLSGLKEKYRVLKPEGVIIILELTQPRNRILKYLYAIYSHTLIPFIGKLVSSDSRAYSYLPKSIEAFPQGEKFIALLEKAGFIECNMNRLTFGICTLYFGRKSSLPYSCSKQFFF